MDTQPLTFYQKNQQVKDRLDSTGPGMCLAKWTQITLHLATGHAHMCHHPTAHKIPLDELAQDYRALANTRHLKQQREIMLGGSRPSECQYCWNIEDTPSDQEIWSDRVLKSRQDWALGRIDEIETSNSQDIVIPSYLEVSFSNACNFKCSYCSPEISSAWMEEIESQGPIKLNYEHNNIEYLKRVEKFPIPNRMDNPYVDAFWQWWPELYPSLHTFRITGGEPLMTKNTFKVLDWIIANPRPDMELAINSNFCVDKKIFDRFIEKAQQIQALGAVKLLTVFTSAEAHGARAEYIRHGMNYSQWLANCYEFIEKVPTAKLAIMSTYNALSVTSYTDFMKDVVELNKAATLPIIFDIPYLHYPSFLSIGILDQSFVEPIQDSIDFMRTHISNDGKGFSPYEILKLERIQQMFTGRTGQDRTQDRRNFADFVDQHDARRGTNFLDTFPEMHEFYTMCKGIS